MLFSVVRARESAVSLLSYNGGYIANGACIFYGEPIMFIYNDYQKWALINIEICHRCKSNYIKERAINILIDDFNTKN